MCSNSVMQRRDMEEEVDARKKQEIFEGDLRFQDNDNLVQTF